MTRIRGRRGSTSPRGGARARRARFFVRPLRARALPPARARRKSGPSTNDLAAAAADRGDPEGDDLRRRRADRGPRPARAHRGFRPPTPGCTCRRSCGAPRSRRGSRWRAAWRWPTASARRRACRCRSMAERHRPRVDGAGFRRGVRSPGPGRGLVRCGGRAARGSSAWASISAVGVSAGACRPRRGD